MNVEFFIIDKNTIDPPDGRYFALLKWPDGSTYRREWGVIEYRSGIPKVLSTPANLSDNTENIEVLAYGQVPTVTEKTTYHF